MKAEFDAIAINYDFDFTNSVIGQLQRKQVYDFLDPILKSLNGNKILDLGCGTGEDAIWFAEKKFSITAIDYSAEMIEVARQKTESKKLEYNIKFYLLSITEIEELPKELKFDLIFSNFGALNCIDPSGFDSVSKILSKRLNPGGHIVAVVLNRFCLWESVYFVFKRKFNQVFRRMKKDGIMASLSADVKVKTWYYSPNGFYSFFKSGFNNQRFSIIGFFVPPSYLTWFQKNNKSKWLSLFNTLDHYNPFKKICSYASDHFIIHMTKK